MNTVIPELSPRDEIEHDPRIWHFAFHGIPDLPELLFQPNIPLHFGYFYDVISDKSQGVTEAVRQRYVKSYAAPILLRQGFEFYRSFDAEMKDNTAAQQTLETAILYLRGEQEIGDLVAYLKGFWAAGINKAEASRVKGAGHFCPDEQLASTWTAISRFIEERFSSNNQERTKHE
ncbi:alpha/beta hydrolase [Stomatohabitans albus]|uniref:alpha/beta fold hydrolase n=1 Tax=Stomatohabitans albus TaxID=3110766 RepID=UPI00300CC071